MSRVFVTSDTHFGHANIIKYCSRPFRDANQMNFDLIERWNSRVRESDTVYFLGDFAMGPGVTPNFIANTLCALNGTKIVLLGNHDQPSKYSPGLKAIVEDKSMYIRNTTIIPESVCAFLIDGKTFVMSHFPLNDWDKRSQGAIHLHGHTHTQYNDQKIIFCGGPTFDIGVDMYGGPVQITGDLRYLNDPRGWA